MAFSLNEFSRLRPYVFHLTARENIARIRRTALLESASVLSGHAGRSDLLSIRRREHVLIQIADEPVILRDQAPLHYGNMSLDAEWTFAEFVQHLNERVFFWPGGSNGPIAYGVRHFERYRPEGPVLLRLPFTELLTANPSIELYFCRFNSGSPRWSYGSAAPRGSSTFVTAEHAAFRAAQVVEVTAKHSIILPPTTEYGSDIHGPWRQLF